MREWEDWTLDQHLGQASGGRRVRLKIQIRMQGQPVEPSVEVEMREGIDDCGQSGTGIPDKTHWRVTCCV